jgi:hypothetical protein
MRRIERSVSTGEQFADRLVENWILSIEPWISWTSFAAGPKGSSEARKSYRRA